jgi:hypothetical protein
LSSKVIGRGRSKVLRRHELALWLYLYLQYVYIYISFSSMAEKAELPGVSQESAVLNFRFRERSSPVWVEGLRPRA